MPRLRFDAPVDPVVTLGRLTIMSGDPTCRFERGEVWCAFRTEDGPASVRYARASDREVDVEAWGPGADRALAMAPDHLGASDRPDEFETDHPLLAPMVRRYEGLRFGRMGRIFERLVTVILGQKVTGAGSMRSFRELVFQYGERAPGPHPKLWLQPSSEQVRELSYADFHPLGVERRRAETILIVARRAKRIGAMISQSSAEAGARLGSLPGIGPWTIGHVQSACFGDPDAVPVNDYNLPNAVTFAFTGEPRGDDARMLELLEPFRPHRGRVVALLALGGPSPPRFGPRLSVRDIRGS